jgi:glycosyltransferase involved in cell wall biosynthesis
MNVKGKEKLLLLSPLPPPTGGIASWSVHVLNYYNSIKSHSKFIVIHQNTAKKIGRITNHWWGNRFISGLYNSFSVVYNLNGNIKKIKPDVVHLTSSASWGLFKDYISQTLIRFHGISHIVHFRFGRIPELAIKKNWEWRFLKVIIRRSTKTIVIDKLSYSILIQSGFDNIEYLPNPISLRFLEMIADYKKEGIERNARKIVFVGHVIPAKGIYELLEACMEISSIELELIGPYESETMEKLYAIAGQKRDGRWLNISGTQECDSVVKSMLSANVFCLPSYTEGFPNVILESMACACPIVATSVGAIPDMLNIDEVDENKCGICITPRNVDNLKNSIEFLLNNRNVANQYGENAQKRVLENYSMPIIWEKMENIWDRVRS